MAKILVVDDEAVIREPIAASLRAHGHEVTCAGDARAAMVQIKTHVPDLILLDVRMPEQDGVSLLRNLRSDSSTVGLPVLLLSNTTEKSVVLEAARFGASGYILKSAFRLDELLLRIKKLCEPEDEPVVQGMIAGTRSKTATAVGNVTLSNPKPAITPSAVVAGAPADPASWPKLLTREQTLERLNHAAGGKTIAGVVAQLISVANSPNSDLADVVRVIQADPVLAARVLHLANSASTGSRGRVRSIDEAARNLGARGIYNMAISIGIIGAFPADEICGFNTIRCWQHSYAVAELLNVLHREQNTGQESTSRLLGLCHDLGELLVRQFFAAEYQRVLEFSQAHGLSVRQVQKNALGMRHPELVGRLLARIGLPINVVNAIREFHEGETGQSGGTSAQTQGLMLANLGAHGLLLAASMHDVVRPITRTEWLQFSTGKPPPIDPMSKRVEYLTAMSILACVSSNEEATLLTPLIQPSGKRLWYVRPGNYVDFDPLAFALALSGELRVSDKMPSDDQWHEIDAVVIVGIRAGMQGMVPAELRRLAEASGKANLPILALVSQNLQAKTQRNVLLRSYPIALEDLGAWVASIGSADQVPSK